MQIDIPPEFRKACRNLGQDLARKTRAMSVADANTLLVQTAIIGIDRNEAKAIREFIDDFLNKGLSSKQRVDFWRETPSEIYFYDGEHVEGFLRLLGARLVQPPYQES
ncbi:MAG: hypothetical protein WC026_07465 [Hyphomicrobium sp.]|uniref:hypothetical protein n=1 Tax=Hyphomicrobium sp. TaxID=82 RepID=UPI0035692D20